MRTFPNNVSDSIPLDLLPEFIQKELGKQHTKTMAEKIECSFCNATARFVAEIDCDPSGYCFMCDGCNTSKQHFGTHKVMREVREIERQISQLKSRLRQIYPYSDTLNRYDDVERGQILSSMFYLPSHGCVVWFEYGKLQYCEENNFFESGFQEAGTVDCVEDQSFLDAINEHFGTSLKMDQFYC